MGINVVMDPNKPEQWIHRPLTHESIPAALKSKSYAQIVRTEGGEDWLRADRSEDPFALVTLKLYREWRVSNEDSGGVLPPFGTDIPNEAASVVEVGAVVPLPLTPAIEEEIAFEDIPFDSIADVPPAALGGEVAAVPPEPNTPVDAPSAPVAKVDAVQAPAANGVASAAPADTAAAPPKAGGAKPDSKKKGVKLNKVTDHVVASAEELLRQAKMATEVVAPLEDAVRKAERHLDAELCAIASESDGVGAHARKDAVLEDAIIMLRTAIPKISDNTAAGWAAKRIRAVKAESKAAGYEASAHVDRAARRELLITRAVFPKLEEYCKAVPIEQRATEKTIRLNMGGRLTFTEVGDDWDFGDERTLPKTIESAIGKDAAIKLGLLRQRMEIDPSALRAYLEKLDPVKDKEVISKLRITFVPKHDELRIFDK